MEHGDTDSRVRYRSSEVDAPASCVPETQTRLCSNGVYGDWSGSYTDSTCVVNAQCTNPDNVHGGVDTRTAYEAQQVNAPATCNSEQQSRICNQSFFISLRVKFYNVSYRACQV